MKEVVLVMQGKELQELEALIQEMPFKYAQPLLEKLGKNVKEVQQEEEEQSKEKKK